MVQRLAERLESDTGPLALPDASLPCDIAANAERVTVQVVETKPATRPATTPTTRPATKPTTRLTTATLTADRLPTTADRYAADDIPRSRLTRGRCPAYCTGTAHEGRRCRSDAPVLSAQSARAPCPAPPPLRQVRGTPGSR